MNYPQMETSVYVRRHRPDGSMMVVPCVMSLLSPDDFEDAVRLHDEVAHGLSMDIFVPSTPDEIQRYLGGEGLSVGIKHEGRLICLRTAITGAEWARYTAESMGLPPEEAERAACTGFCVVDKEFRGNNVQFLSQYYAENIIAESCDKILKDPAPLITLSNHGQNSLDILARYYTKTDDFWDVHWYMMEAVKKAFDKYGISIPYPQLDVHIANNDAASSKNK